MPVASCQCGSNFPTGNWKLVTGNYNTHPVFKRKTEGSVLCTSCGVLVGVNDPHLLQLRPPQSRPLGLRPRAAQPRQRPRLRQLSSPAARSSCTCCRWCCRATASRSMSAAQRAIAATYSAPAAPSPVFGVGWWWTRADRRLAARRHPPHLLQRDVDSSARARDREPVRRRAHDHHLHDRRHHRLRAEQRAGLVADIPFFGAPLTVGASASIFGFLGALVHYGRRTRQQPHRPGRAAVRADHGRHGLRLARASTTPRTSADSSAAISRR